VAIRQVAFTGRVHLLCLGGEDHYLCIPFLLGLRERGCGQRYPLVRSGFRYLGDISAVKRLRRLAIEVNPQIVQSFDTTIQSLAKHI
jgi:hypothetical protein